VSSGGETGGLCSGTETIVSGELLIGSVEDEVFGTADADFPLELAAVWTWRVSWFLEPARFTDMDQIAELVEREIAIITIIHAHPPAKRKCSR
jgi:hypothetical protein